MELIELMITAAAFATLGAMGANMVSRRKVGQATQLANNVAAELVATEQRLHDQGRALIAAMGEAKELKYKYFDECEYSDRLAKELEVEGKGRQAASDDKRADRVAYCTNGVERAAKAAQAVKDRIAYESQRGSV
jgi:hypothetical protein